MITLWALALRFHRLYYRPFWNDEDYQFHTMEGAFKPFWKDYYNFGDHTSFPGDYVLCYPFIKIFGYSKWGLAIPHILITILGFYWLYRICQRTYRSVWVTAICFFVIAVNNELIFHHFEFRPYAVLPTLALGTYLYADIMIRDYRDTSKASRWFAGFVLIFTFFYHAYGVLVALFPVLYCMIRYRRGSYRSWLLSEQGRFFVAVIVIGLSIWVWFAMPNHLGIIPTRTAQHTTITALQSINYPFQFIAHPLVEPVSFFKSIIGNLLGYNKMSYLFLAGFLFWFFPSESRRDQLVFLMWLIIIPLILILIVDLKNQYWFLQRQFVWVMPWFALLLGWLWDTGIHSFSSRTSAR